MSLKIGMVTLGCQENDAEGQACFIRTQHGIAMATVKHNFCTEFNNDGNVAECVSVLVATLESGLYSFDQWRSTL